MPVLWVEAFVWFEEECIWADGIWEIAQGVQEKGNQTIWTLCVILEEKCRKETIISSDNWWSGDAAHKGITWFS